MFYTYEICDNHQNKCGNIGVEIQIVANKKASLTKYALF